MFTFTFISWPKNEIVDIYAKIKEFQEKTRLAEEELIYNNPEDNKSKLQALNAEYINF